MGKRYRSDPDPVEIARIFLPNVVGKLGAVVEALGFWYVACTGSNAIAVVDPEAQVLLQLHTDDGYLVRPTVMCPVPTGVVTSLCVGTNDGITILAVNNATGFLTLRSTITVVGVSDVLPLGNACLVGWGTKDSGAIACLAFNESSSPSWFGEAASLPSRPCGMALLCPESKQRHYVAVNVPEQRVVEVFQLRETTHETVDASRHCRVGMTRVHRYCLDVLRVSGNCCMFAHGTTVVVGCRTPAVALCFSLKCSASGDGDEERVELVVHAGGNGKVAMRTFHHTADIASIQSFHDGVNHRVLAFFGSGVIGIFNLPSDRAAQEPAATQSGLRILSKSKSSSADEDEDDELTHHSQATGLGCRSGCVSSSRAALCCAVPQGGAARSCDGNCPMNCAYVAVFDLKVCMKEPEDVDDEKTKLHEPDSVSSKRPSGKSCCVQ